MKLFPVRQLIWSGFLVLWASKVIEGYNQDVCQEELQMWPLYVQNSSLQDFILMDMTTVNETFTCLLYPTNLLNCSWSFDTLQKDTQLSVHISVCHGNTSVQSLNYLSEERVGSEALVLLQHDNLYVIIQFNMSLHDSWKLYTYKYNIDKLEVLSPPVNVTATVKDGGLLVTWGPPNNRSRPSCFEYQLDLGDQETPKQWSGQLSYTELNVDPTRTYRVRMRTRKVDICIKFSQWSEWSPTVTVEQSVYKLNTLLIILISLGIPMILLAVLLLVRHQRVSKLLFPPIPRPPPKYTYFLEKNETFNSFYPALSPKAEEEITEVEDTE
ncbi:interleukin-5 receptor subunit alpha-like isoform X2 [Xiphias gladius]|uniref:interleukin-5 receptor subunit alpha-like isoform X2 n=1 Tax=Xiphias gladius TaxID=8245 RepID=UPI001A998679|nr:interleukin-5 receptor subunit alpha-like isoform X2 [Xiphias gladius]XP_040000701.1 interleukin-5 receptor subunit alpha-like isoform X2 [Xiphias gladius]